MTTRSDTKDLSKGELVRELHESRERLLTAQRVARVGFLDWDLKTNEIILSEETQELTGYRATGAVVTPEFVANTVHPDDLASVGEQLDLAIKGIKPYDVVHRHVRPDGTVVWVHAQAELTRDEQGTPARLLGTMVDITPQKQVEQALRESELRYRTLYETAGDAILLMRQDRFIDCNRRALQLYGTTRALLIGAPPYKYSPPTQPDGRDSTEKALEKINRAFTKGPQFFEWVHCREDRTEFDAEVSLNRLELGGEVLVQAIVRDVTKRKHTEAALLASEREYRELMTLANSIILRWTRDGRITFLNEFGLKFFGFTAEEILGRHVVGTIVPESESTGRDLRPLMDEVCADPQRFARNTNENVRRNGERVWIDWTNRVLLDARGGIREILSIGSDITERRRAEEALRRSEATLRAVFEAAPVGICIMKDRAFMSPNRYWCETFGYPEASIIGKDTRMLYESDAEYERVGKALYADLRERGVTSIETRMRHGDGSWSDVVVSAAPLHRDDLSAGVLAIAHDITERKRAEEKLEQFAEQLRELSAHIEAAREEERTGIAREIHDQLGQALTVFKMDLSWIARRAVSEAGLSREQLLEKVKGLVQMTDETIDEVRRISSELRPAILDQVGLGAALAWKAKELEERTQLACLVDSSLPADAKLDRALTSAVFRVFQEALTNVVRHAEATRVDVRLARSDGSLVLEVRDDGRGIKEEEIANPHSLGLLGIRERLRPFGGTVAFARGQPKGTVVTVRVPIAV
jgi:PAS domain S-box-containing protein